jgi:hypothetical protein
LFISDVIGDRVDSFVKNRQLKLWHEGNLELPSANCKPVDLS